MTKTELILETYGLKIRESDSPDRENVDFDITDSEDNVAWVWGDRLSDVDWECNHPYECLEIDSEDEQGRCVLCGSFCDWHTEPDDQGNQVPEPHDWYPRSKVGGLIGKYLEELREKEYGEAL